MWGTTNSNAAIRCSNTILLTFPEEAAVTYLLYIEIRAVFVDLFFSVVMYISMKKFISGEVVINLSVDNLLHDFT